MRQTLIQMAEAASAGEPVADAMTGTERLAAIDQTFTDLQAVIADIQAIPGYEDFFARPDFAAIQRALSSGGSQPEAGVYLLVDFRRRLGPYRPCQRRHCGPACRTNQRNGK